MARTAPILAFNAKAVTGTNAYSSVIIPAAHIFCVSIQAVTSGSNPNGALKMQFSNDNPTAGIDPTNWSDVVDATVSTTSNGVYSIQPNHSQKIEICANFIKLVYTNASGSGVISAHVEIFGL